VWYPTKTLYISYTLFAATKMLYFSVYEPIAIKMLPGEPSPNLRGGCGVRESSMIPRESP
jgi:hypothetical protein